MLRGILDYLFYIFLGIMGAFIAFSLAAGIHTFIQWLKNKK